MTYRQLLTANPDFRRLWTGQVVSEIGDWLNNIAVLALTLELAGAHRQGLAIAVYAIARHLPLFVFGPLAGVVVDRASRRRVMISADAARALLALGFIVADRWAMLPLIYVVGALLFSVSAFFNAAKRAAIPNIVRDPMQLLSANSLSASTTAATIAVGSALGGIIATFTNRNVVFALNALTFLVSAEMIRRIRATTKELKPSLNDETRASYDAATAVSFKSKQLELETSGDAGSLERAGLAAETVAAAVAPSRGGLFARLNDLRHAIITDFLQGLRYVRAHQVLSSIFLVAAGWGLGNGVARALYSVFGARLGETSVAGLVARPVDFGISVLFVAMGLGGVTGAPVARRFNAASSRAKLGARMGRSMVFDGCGLAVFSLMPTLWTAALVLTAREANFAIWWTAQQTMMMTETDDRYAGRVFASFETLTTLMMVGSMLLAGAAADVYGIRIVACVGGIVIAFSGLLWFALRRRAPPASNVNLRASENISV